MPVYLYVTATCRCIFTSQQHAGVSLRHSNTPVYLYVTSTCRCIFTSQQHAGVSLRHSNMPVYLYVTATCQCILRTDLLRQDTLTQNLQITQSQYNDTGPASPIADAITPCAWQDNHWMTSCLFFCFVLFVFFLVGIEARAADLEAGTFTICQRGPGTGGGHLYHRSAWPWDWRRAPLP